MLPRGWGGQMILIFHSLGPCFHVCLRDSNFKSCIQRWYVESTPLDPGTGRMGQSGTAITICTDVERWMLGRSLLGSGWRYFLFLPLPGEIIQFYLQYFFQMAWNHQLVTSFCLWKQDWYRWWSVSKHEMLFLVMFLDLYFSEGTFLNS